MKEAVERGVVAVAVGIRERKGLPPESSIIKAHSRLFMNRHYGIAIDPVSSGHGGDEVKSNQIVGLLDAADGADQVIHLMEFGGGGVESIYWYRDLSASKGTEQQVQVFVKGELKELIVHIQVMGAFQNFTGVGERHRAHPVADTIDELPFRGSAEHLELSC